MKFPETPDEFVAAIEEFDEKVRQIIAAYGIEITAIPMEEWQRQFNEGTKKKQEAG